MRFVQTFYGDPSKDIFTNGFGWVRPEFNLMSWALSCLQLRRYYSEVELYTDDRIAKIFTEDLKLPYTSVHTVFNDFDKIDDRLWALPKIYTYSLQDAPFLHVDGDVFLFEGLPKELLKGELIAQNKEVATMYYTSTQEQLMKEFSYFPDCVRKAFYAKELIEGLNAGILGGRDIEFFHEYTKEAYSYILNNKEHLKAIDADKFNVFFEQHLFYDLAKGNGKEIRYLFNDIIKDRGYLYLGNFHEVPLSKKYLHLLGHYKTDERTCVQMANKLRELYPDYFYRVVELFKRRGLDLYLDFYKDKPIETEQGYTFLDAYSNSIFLGDIVVTNELKGFSSDNSEFVNELNKSILSVVPKGRRTVGLMSDLSKFNDELSFTINGDVSEHYLYGRDILSSSWVHGINLNLLQDKPVLLKQAKCVAIIESKYNWAGLFNKYYRRGVEYYEELEVEVGMYYNLIIPELHPTVCLLYDIDEMDKLVLDFFSEEHSLDELLKSFEQYIDEDVLRDDYETYKSYIMSVITRLVTCKAIYPTNIDYGERVKDVG